MGFKESMTLKVVSDDGGSEIIMTHRCTNEYTMERFVGVADPLHVEWCLERLNLLMPAVL